MPPVNPPRVSPSDSSAVPAARSTGFSMEGFMSDLAEQNKLRDQRQQEQAAVALQQKTIMDQSTKLAQEQAGSMGFMLQDFNTARAKTTHARELEDGGLFDNLRLAGLQLMDPAGYDPVERSKRLQEDSQQAALLNQFYGYKQGALKAQLEGSTSQLDYLKNLEAIGHEKLTAFADQAALIHQNVSAMQVARDDAMHDLNPDQIGAAITQAQTSKTKTANIAGVDIPLQDLQDRQTNLIERNSANLSAKVANILAQDDSNNVGNTLASREAQRTLEQNARDHLGMTIATTNAQQTQLAQQLIDDSKARDLRTRSLTEAQQIRDNGYKSQSGETYDPAAVENIITQRKAAQQDQINEALTQNSLKNFDTAQLAQERGRVQDSLKRFPVGSPVAKAAQEYYSALGVSATGIGPENGMITRITAMEGYAAAKDKYDKTLQAQAILDGKGDKNLAEMRLDWYRGNPVQQDTLTNAAVDRLTKFKSVADLFPADVAPKIEKKYRELVQQKQQRGLMDPSLTETDKKAAQSDAAQEAIDWGVQQGLQGQSQAIMLAQLQDPTHPASNMPVSQFGSLIATADLAARNQWLKANGLTDAQGTQIENGIPIPGKDLGTLISNRKYLENVNLMQNLDAQRPGLGHEYAQWWADKGAKFAGAISDTLNQKGNTSFQGTVFGSQVGSTIQNQLMQYSMTLQQADEGYQKEFVKRNTDLLTFGGSAENSQIAVLDRTPGISDREKQQIFGTVIRPLLDQAKTKGMDMDQTNNYVESQIQNYVPQTPMMKELMRITRKDRPQVLSDLNSWKSMFARFMDVIEPGGPLHATADIPWYKDWQKQNNQGKQPDVSTPWLTYKKPQ